MHTFHQTGAPTVCDGCGGVIDLGHPVLAMGDGRFHSRPCYDMARPLDDAIREQEAAVLAARFALLDAEVRLKALLVQKDKV